MRHRFTIALLTGALVLATLPEAAKASFAGLEFGLDAGHGSPCSLRVRTRQWAASDFATYVVARWRDVRAGDLGEIAITAPNGRRLLRSGRWDRDAKNACGSAFVPIPGTPAETWLGTWRVVVSLNGRQVGEGSIELVPAREGALEEAQRLLAASPNSARAHYRVGGTAAIVGQLELAERHLREASRLSPTWWLPPMALARVYLRQGKREEARRQLVFLHGLLLGRTDEPGTAVAFYRQMLEDLWKEVGE